MEAYDIKFVGKIEKKKTNIKYLKPIAIASSSSSHYNDWSWKNIIQIIILIKRQQRQRVNAINIRFSTLSYSLVY